MRHTLLLLAATGLLAVALPAQQYNSFMATMMFNNQGGPPVPINPVNCPRGYPVNAMVQSGLQWQPFVVGYSPTLLAVGAPWGPNIVDLSPVGMQLPFNGLMNPVFNTGATGTWLTQFTIANTAPVGAASCWQTAIVNPASSVGATLTAATRLVITQGITTTSLALGDDQSVNVSLATYGFSLPFYAQNYTNFFVHSNGEILFNSGSTDFTPTTSEFVSQMPRICGEWTDLSPNLGGTVTVYVDQGTTPPNVHVDFVNVPEFGNGALHTFSMKIWAAPVGDVEIYSAPTTAMSFYDMLVGITAGSNLGPQNAANPMKDLSAMNINPIPGLANENFHEWFGTTNGSMPYYQPTPYVSRPFDLNGTTQVFIAAGAGAPNAAYLGTSAP
jgi:hypothetical protein